MKVLVTGGAGFVGSNLVMMLHEEGHDVTVVDDLSTGRRENLDSLQIDFHIGDVAHDECGPMPRFDLIYHLACPASPKAYQADPIKTWDTAVLGMRVMINIANDCGCPLVFTSTSEVYGDPEVHPQHEDYSGNVRTWSPRAVYDEGKRAAETLCFEARRQWDLDVRVLRLFNTYGPGMAVDDGRVVSNFVVQALTNRPLTVYGDGRQTRSCCYVGDMVEALMLAGRADKAGKHWDRPVNVGNPEEHTIEQIASAVIDAVGGEWPYAHEVLPLPADDPTRRCPDIRHVVNILGWQPHTSLREGLLPTVRWFRGELVRIGLLR